MSIFGDKIFSNDSVAVDKGLLEALIIREFNEELNAEEKEEFLKSEECEELIEAGILSEASLVYLDRTDDLTKRTKIAAMNFAREAKDPLFDKLAVNRVKERMLLKQIMKKYGHKGAKAAKKAQREIIKAEPRKFKKKITIK